MWDHFDEGFRKIDEAFRDFDKGFARASKKQAIQKGWSCPKCGAVWAPTTPGCFTCNKPVTP